MAATPSSATGSANETEQVLAAIASVSHFNGEVNRVLEGIIIFITLFKTGYFFHEI
jgi:hypothetical protein